MVSQRKKIIASDNIINALSEWTGIDVSTATVLGHGFHGTAYLLADGRVMKKTNDEDEVLYAQLIKKFNTSNNIANVHQIAKFISYEKPVKDLATGKIEFKLSNTEQSFYVVIKELIPYSSNEVFISTSDRDAYNTFIDVLDEFIQHRPHGRRSAFFKHGTFDFEEALDYIGASRQQLRKQLTIIGHALLGAFKEFFKMGIVFNDLDTRDIRFRDAYTPVYIDPGGRSYRVSAHGASLSDVDVITIKTVNNEHNTLLRNFIKEVSKFTPHWKRQTTKPSIDDAFDVVDMFVEKFKDEIDDDISTTFKRDTYNNDVK